MDAHAHLISLGWAGPGHALDSKPYKQKGHRGLAYDPSNATNTGNGLVKPLLVSQKQGRLGVGKRAHEPQAGNEWWLKGFESALGNIGKSESERSSGTSTPVQPAYNPLAGKHGGLYSFFIRGQNMEGTIGRVETIELSDPASSSSRKRKSDNLQESDIATQGVPKTSKKQKTAEEFAQVTEYLLLRDKDQHRKRRTNRPSPIEEFQQVGEYLAARSEKEDKKKRKREAEEEPTVLFEEPNSTEHVETKEERRERRRRRKEERRLKSENVSGAEIGTPSATEMDDAAAKATRRAERKKRKAEKAAKAAR